MSGLAAAGQAVDIVKKLRELEKQFNSAELRLQIADLYSVLAETKIALADAKQALQDKDEEIRSLKEIKAKKFRTVTYRGYSFGIDANGKSIGRPFCQKCEQTKGHQIQISRFNATRDHCPACNAVYSGHPYQLPAGFDILAELDSAKD